MTAQSPELFYRELGEADAPPLMILHGLLGTSDNWQTLGKQFAATHRVHIIDQRNHGRSPHNPVHNYSAMANDVLHHLDRTGIDRASIIGHSMGGKTALMFAHLHPDRVQKLVVADMAARSYAPHHGPIFDALLSAPIGAAPGRSEVEQHLMDRLADPSMVGFLMKNLRREKAGGFAWRPNISVLAQALSEVVDAVPMGMNTLPTLAIYGGQSNYVNEQDLEAFGDACMQFQSHEIEDAGHWLHASHPEEFFEEVSSFLQA